MDKWKESELQKMQVGGNRQAMEFLRSQSDFKPDWNFNQKYQSKAAALYRDKISSVAEGRDWTPETSAAKDWIPFGGGSTSGGGGMKGSYSYSAVKNSNMNDDYNRVDSSYQRDDWFDDENSGMHRSDSYPNSGKYTGFGNNAFEPKKQNEILENAMSSLSMGWSAFSRSAVSAASYAREVGKTAGSKAYELGGTVQDRVKEGGIMSGVQAGISGLAAKASDYGSKAYQNVEGAWGSRLQSPTDSSPGEKYGLINNPGDEQKGKSTKKGSYNNLGEEDFEWTDLNSPYQGQDNRRTEQEGWHTFDPDSNVNEGFESSGSGPGHSSTKPKSTKSAAKSKKPKKKEQKDELLIDFGDIKTQDKIGKSDWDDAAWETLNN